MKNCEDGQQKTIYWARIEAIPLQKRTWTERFWRAVLSCRSVVLNNPFHVTYQNKEHINTHRNAKLVREAISAGNDPLRLLFSICLQVASSGQIRNTAQSPLYVIYCPEGSLERLQLRDYHHSSQKESEWPSTFCSLANDYAL